jgi:hypothetical protein
MLQNIGDIITEVLVRNNRTTTDGFVTDTMLIDWLRMSNNYCTTFKKWPFSEVRDKSYAWTGAEEVDYSVFTVDYKADSIRLMMVGDKRVEKMNFEDYLLMREERPEANDRVFSDFGRVLFINPYADVSGTMAVYGQYTPKVTDVTDLTSITAFSPYDEEGNEAIVEKMTGYLKRREHLPDEAELHDGRADVKLLQVWEKIQAEQYKYKTGPDSEGMFKFFDVVEGGYRDDLYKRDQF